MTYIKDTAWGRLKLWAARNYIYHVVRHQPIDENVNVTRMYDEWCADTRISYLERRSKCMRATPRIRPATSCTRG